MPQYRFHVCTNLLETHGRSVVKEFNVNKTAATELEARREILEEALGGRLRVVGIELVKVNR